MDVVMIIFSLIKGVDGYLRVARLFLLVAAIFVAENNESTNLSDAVAVIVLFDSSLRGLSFDS